MKSPWTYRHSDLVAMLAARIAAALGADEAEVTDLRRAAMLHDIGKLAISNRVLDKRGPLTAAEVAQVREHPLITARILERIPASPTSRRSPPPTTSGSTAAATPTACAPRTSRGRCACSRWPTSSRR